MPTRYSGKISKCPFCHYIGEADVIHDPTESQQYTSRITLILPQREIQISGEPADHPDRAVANLEAKLKNIENNFPDEFKQALPKRRDHEQSFFA